MYKNKIKIKDSNLKEKMEKLFLELDDDPDINNYYSNLAED